MARIERSEETLLLPDRDRMRISELNGGRDGAFVIVGVAFLNADDPAVRGEFIKAVIGHRSPPTTGAMPGHPAG